MWAVNCSAVHEKMKPLYSFLSLSSSHNTHTQPLSLTPLHPPLTFVLLPVGSHVLSTSPAPVECALE